MTEQEIILDRYVVLGVAGAGGFGTVRIAWDPRIQRKVAIKTIALTDLDALRASIPRVGEVGTPDLANLPGLDEARTAAKLQDPRIVGVFDFEIRGRVAYLIMEYIEGITLTRLLADYSEYITLDMITAIFNAVAGALVAAHSAGVLHLDIKPDNIMINAAGQAKVTDFGLATLADASGHGTAGGGTIGYMPLEQMRREHLDARTDEWSLASVMYEMLTGENPFYAPNLEQASKAILEADLRLPSTCWEGADPQLDDVIFYGLALRAAERYESIEDFAYQLNKFLGNVEKGRAQLALVVQDALNVDNPEMDNVNIDNPKTTYPEMDNSAEAPGGEYAAPRAGAPAAHFGDASRQGTALLNSQFKDRAPEDGGPAETVAVSPESANPNVASAESAPKKAFGWWAREGKPAVSAEPKPSAAKAAPKTPWFLDAAAFAPTIRPADEAYDYADDDEEYEEDASSSAGASPAKRTPLAWRVDELPMRIAAKVFCALGSAALAFFALVNVPLLQQSALGLPVLWPPIEVAGIGTINPSEAVYFAIVGAAAAAGASIFKAPLGPLVGFELLAIAIGSCGHPVVAAALGAASALWYFIMAREGTGGANVALAGPVLGSIGLGCALPFAAGAGLKPIQAGVSAAFAAFVAIVFASFGSASMLGWDAASFWFFAESDITKTFVRIVSRPQTWLLFCSWIAASVALSVFSWRHMRFAIATGVAVACACLLVGALSYAPPTPQIFISVILGAGAVLGLFL